MHWMAAHPLRPQPPESAPLLSVAGTAAGVTDELLGLHAEIMRFVEAASPTPAEVYAKAQALHTVIDACRQALQADYPGMEVGGEQHAPQQLCSAAPVSGGSIQHDALLHQLHARLSDSIGASGSLLKGMHPPA